MFLFRKRTSLPSPSEALPGRSTPIPTAERHFVNGRTLHEPYPEGTGRALFGFGCFWGAERKFWQLGDGIWITAVGYAGGVTPNPTYEEVCSGLTGHNEVVLVVFDPQDPALRRTPEDVLGEPRPDPGHAPGQRRGHPVPLRHLRVRRGAAACGGGVEGGLSAGARRAPATGRSRPRSLEPGRSTSPRIITSSTWRKTRGGYCGLGGTGVVLPDRNRRRGLTFSATARPAHPPCAVRRRDLPMLERLLERFLFASRWLLAPFYVGLVVRARRPAHQGAAGAGAFRAACLQRHRVRRDPRRADPRRPDADRLAHHHRDLLRATRTSSPRSTRARTRTGPSGWARSTSRA